MLNLSIGSGLERDGRACILTNKGVGGHAVYGPYIQLAPGRYVVEFELEVPEAEQAADDAVCAILDVAADTGRHVLAREEFRVSQLRTASLVHLVFTTEVSQALEFRVEANGLIPLLVYDHRRVLRLEEPAINPQPLLDATRFPDPACVQVPEFFTRYMRTLRSLYENGATVAISDNDVIVTIEGVSFYARIEDDLRFVHEIFSQRAYNIQPGRDCCVIDIGMNIGLVTLSFAKQPQVREVHSFEPFLQTYRRAVANLGLNPAISGKVSAHNFGLADADREETIMIQDIGDSGMLSIRGSDEGTPEPIVVRDAAGVLGPIIRAAKARGLEVIAKVDCEGSEFEVFDTLERHDLLQDVTAFAVEWHRGRPGRTNETLIAPLLRRGFIVIDLSGPKGNGFFYAVRR
jgi:FkbM family methyltransferase